MGTFISIQQGKWSYDPGLDVTLSVQFSSPNGSFVITLSFMQINNLGVKTRQRWKTPAFESRKLQRQQGFLRLVSRFPLKRYNVCLPFNT